MATKLFPQKEESLCQSLRNYLPVKRANFEFDTNLLTKLFFEFANRTPYLPTMPLYTSFIAYIATGAVVVSSFVHPVPSSRLAHTRLNLENHIADM